MKIPKCYQLIIPFGGFFFGHVSNFARKPLMNSGVKTYFITVLLWGVYAPQIKASEKLNFWGKNELNFGQLGGKGALKFLKNYRGCRVLLKF